MAGHVCSQFQTGNNILNNLVKHIWHGWRPSENYEAEQAARAGSAAANEERERESASAISLGFTGINRNAPFYLINYATGQHTHTHAHVPNRFLPRYLIFSFSLPLRLGPDRFCAGEHFVLRSLSRSLWLKHMRAVSGAGDHVCIYISFKFLAVQPLPQSRHVCLGFQEIQ